MCKDEVQYPNVVSSGTQPLKLVLSVDDASAEYRIKIGFSFQPDACGKGVKGFPRSIDPCLSPAQAAAELAPKEKFEKLQLFDNCADFSRN